VADDRGARLRNAEKLLGQGRVEQAIAEYLRVVEKHPEDWNVVNLLGDVYLRAGQPDKAIDRFIQAADTLAEQGFISKAGAVYKKVLKVRPDREDALLKASDIARRQGLLAEECAYLAAIVDCRLNRGDRRGAADIAARLESLYTSAGRYASDLIEPEPKQDGDSVGDENPNSAAAQPFDRDFAKDDFSIDWGQKPLTGTMPVDESEEDLDDPGSSATTLDAVFAELRNELSGRLTVTDAQKHYERGLALRREGDIDACIPELQIAAQSPWLYFAAAAELGRTYRDNGLIREAIEWLEQAARAAPPSPADGHLVLYELADLLESSGELSRALAACLELQAEAGSFRDVAHRIVRLGNAQARDPR
jgi:tetratricopeptide (TPR) repeat protein